MKIGISDGCANGGMMDSLSIHPVKDNPTWQPMWTCEVTEEEWSQWNEFLKSHAKWTRFWDGKCR